MFNTWFGIPLPLTLPVLLILGPVEMLPTLAQAQKWFDPRNPTVVAHLPDASVWWYLNL